MSKTFSSGGMKAFGGVSFDSQAKFGQYNLNKIKLICPRCVPSRREAKQAGSLIFKEILEKFGQLNFNKIK